MKSESESILGPLFFFIIRYIEEEVLGDDNISIKKCRTFSYGFKNLVKLGVRIFFSKSPWVGRFLDFRPKL